MPIETSDTRLRENLASILKQVVDDQEVVIVRRRGAEDVALIAAGELAGLMETAHLLRSPRNADRLLRAFARAAGNQIQPETVEKLRREMGLEAKK